MTKKLKAQIIEMDLHGDLAAFFGQHITRVVTEGKALGLDPLNAAITLVQASLGPLIALDRDAAGRLAKSYGEMVTNPPTTDVHQANKAIFAQATLDLAEARDRIANFPPTRGSA